MHFSQFASSLSLLSLVHAGQQAGDSEARSNSCIIPEDGDISSLPESCSVKVDETAPYTGPWTKRPTCIPEKSSSTPYCVYTNDTFANGRGISFFTSPSIAEQILALPAFTEKDLHSKVNQFADPPWEVKNIPGRGNGLFATRTLYRGDEILAATPVGGFQSDALVPDFELDYVYLHTAFVHLPKSTQQLFLGTMAGSPGDPIMERINTNAFSGEFNDLPHFLMYPETAKMNHACRPNAMYYYDPSTLIHRTTAATTIEPGQEITIPYDNILRPRAERQKSLSDYWKFECTCSLCTASETDIAASDARIAEIIDLQTKLANWSPWSEGTPTMAEMLISLYEDEHLHAAKATGHTFAALAHNAVGNKMMAEWHAELAIEAGMVNSGPNDDVTAMNQLLDDPEGHWTWNARSPKKDEL